MEVLNITHQNQHLMDLIEVEALSDLHFEQLSSQSALVLRSPQPFC